MQKRGNGFLIFLGGLFLTILVLGIIFEIILLVIAYKYSDKVECNLLWCSFTFKDESMNNTIESYSISNITKNSVCYLNNIEVNCSEYIKWEPYNGTQ